MELQDLVVVVEAEAQADLMVRTPPLAEVVVETAVSMVVAEVAVTMATVVRQAEMEVREACVFASTTQVSQLEHSLQPM
tara:strand:+ start:64 stop:300 length:237 start_codon:yes stop_codon:yes gene_type:complete